MSNESTSTTNTQTQKQEQAGFWSSFLSGVRYSAEGAAATAQFTAITAKTGVNLIKAAAESIEELGNNTETVKDSIQGLGRSIHVGLVSLEGFSLRAVNSALPNGQKMSMTEWQDTATRQKRVFYASAGLDKDGNPINDPEDESENKPSESSVKLSSEETEIVKEILNQMKANAGGDAKTLLALLKAEAEAKKAAPSEVKSN